MYLICFGTRPEIIKLIPLIREFKKNDIQFKTLFSGQHENLIENFYYYIDKPDYTLTNIMNHNQTLNKLSSKIIMNMDQVYDSENFTHVIVQGDTTTAFSIALTAFHRKLKVIHLEAGLRTNNKNSPYPEELNRRLISQIADIHLCPTELSVNNLKKEQITHNVFLVGNTVVDSYKYIYENTTPDNEIKDIISKNKYIVVTLHRRENRGDKIESMWSQLNSLSEKHKFIYIMHPSLPDSITKLNENITVLRPQNYENMVHLISNSFGIITDSGGLQEEAVCANKRVLICRDTTERPETIECGLGKLIDTSISDNMDFFTNDNSETVINPYGINVCEKIIDAFNELV